MDFFVKLPAHHQPALVFFTIIVYLVDAGYDSVQENNKLLDQLWRRKICQVSKVPFKNQILKKAFYIFILLRWPAG